MRATILLTAVFCLLGLNLSFSQVKENKNPDPKLQVRQIISKQVTYPEFAIDLGIEGTVYASFLVNEDGTLKVIEVSSANDRLKEYVEKKLKEIKVTAGQEANEIYNMKFSFELM